MTHISRSDAARRDLIQHFVYLAENAGLETADRFLSGVETSFTHLLSYPLSGAPLETQHQRLGGMHKWPVKGFDNWQIFYLTNANGVHIVRILHAASDWWTSLEPVKS